MWIWFVLASGLLNVAASFVMKTNNFQSSLIFKVVPFVVGTGCLIYFFATMGLIAVN